MRLETTAIHAGHRPDPATGAVIQPIYLSTTFERDDDGGYPHEFIYGRSDNPNRRSLETCLAELEGGKAAAAFASGSAAAAAVFQTLRPGDHVIAPSDIYHGTARLLREVMEPWGLQTTFADLTDLGAVSNALRPNTRLIWVESPSNPLLKITDIQAIADLAKSRGALVACDNTWATPVLQRPLALGADLAVHATTKYLGGHSDLLGGAVVARKAGEVFDRVRHLQGVAGSIPSPFDCWLLMRGIQTLPYRMRAHCDNAARLAEYLNRHGRITAVHYPGLPKHPGHDVASAQMTGYGGMLSFEVAGGREAAMAVAARLKLFTRATSLGGTESLVEHRASIEGPASRTPPGLLRLSVGLEHPDDLIEDLEQALSAG